MSEDVTFRGISRFKLIHFLSLLSHKYDSYRQQQIREWHLERDLERIKILSKDIKDGEELLFTVRDVENKLVRFFGSETNLAPKDKKLLKNLHTELNRLNSKFMSFEKNPEEDEFSRRQKKIALELRKLNQKLLEEEHQFNEGISSIDSNLRDDDSDIEKVTDIGLNSPNTELVDVSKKKGQQKISKPALEIHELNASDLLKEDKKRIPKHHKAAEALKNSISEFKDHKSKMKNQILNEHKKKIELLELKYHELKESPFVKKEQLNLIKTRIDKLKSEVA